MADEGISSSTYVQVACLEHLIDVQSGLGKIRLDPLPYLIGRTDSANFVIRSERVSRRHAEIFRREKEFFIRDLGTKNGTFVNGRLVSESLLQPGDTIHIDSKEFRFCIDLHLVDRDASSEATRVGNHSLPKSFISDLHHLQDMLHQGRVSSDFQPIVRISDGATIGFEGLGRGLHEHLERAPAPLFRLADLLGVAPDLSRAFARGAAIQAANYLPSPSFIFLNTHPNEMGDPNLADFIGEVAQHLRPDQNLVIEIHEKAVTDVAFLRRLRLELKGFGVRLAYDDFGAGQARLLELVEAPPDFLKLDASLIRGIQDSPQRRELIGALTRISNELGISVIAEAVENPLEATICAELGCKFGQGFHFARPQPASTFRPSAEPAAAPKSP